MTESNNLFGSKSELEKLRDLDYKTESHTFSKGVIAAYYNGMEYPMEVRNDYIRVSRKKGDVVFCMPHCPTFRADKDTIYSLVKSDYTKVKTKEVVYDFDRIFANPTKQVRRAITLRERKEIGGRGIMLQDKESIQNLYNEWYLQKLADPKVFRIAFTPKRYKRCFELAVKGFNIWDQAYFVNGELYAAICYEVQGDIAFELAYISRFWDKKLKLTNDLNELILTDSFYQLYQKGVKKVNVGTTAGIRGLKTFKSKLPFTENVIYSN